jgi:serine/threonine protein kinase
VTQLPERYQLLEGSRPGTLQRARDLQTAQTVVLRNVRLPRDDEDEALRRIECAKGIFHPSLITLFDVVRLPEGRVLLAYEYVPSQTVMQVSGGHPFHPKRAAEILTELGDAVAELHARELPHGGISQTTVLLTMKGKAKLDRVGDPTVSILQTPSIGRDLAALGDLLQELVGRPGPGVAGMQAIETVIARARSGALESAATFAAMLRKL